MGRAAVADDGRMTHTTQMPLTRPRTGRVVAGVSTALAERSALPVWAIRSGFLGLTILGGLGIVAYVAAWGLIRAEGETDTPFAAWWNRRTQSGSQQVGWWALTILGLSFVAAVSTLSTPFVVLSVIALVAWGMLDTDEVTA